MQPFEIMISESQERMCAIVEPSRLDAVIETCTPLGHRRHGDRQGHRGRDPARVHDGEVVGDIPVETLVDGAPRYEVERHAPGPPARPAARASPGERTSRRVLRTLLGSPNLGQPPLDLPAVRPAGRLGHGGAAGRRCRRGAADSVRRAIAISLDGNGGRTCARSAPRRRGRGAARRPATSPARARSRRRSRTASTSATPRTGEVGYELAEAIEGMSRWPARRSACRWSRATSRSTTSTSGSPSTRRR